MTGGRGALVGLAMALASAGVASVDGSGEPPPLATDAPEVVEAVQELLGRLRVGPEREEAPFDRDLFRHWSDFDGDGCDTRQEVLKAERRSGRVDGCAVKAGRWFSVYDSVSTTSASSLDVDHVVALGEAWHSGADRWSPEQRELYANDVGYRDSLIAVSARSNRQKSDNDPAEWRPSRRAVWCRYATAWTTVKIRWGLRADAAEVKALREMFDTCRRPPPTTVARAEA